MSAAWSNVPRVFSQFNPHTVRSGIDDISYARATRDVLHEFVSCGESLLRTNQFGTDRSVADTYAGTWDRADLPPLSQALDEAVKRARACDMLLEFALDYF